MRKYGKILLLAAVFFIGGAAFAGAKSEPLELIFEHYTSDDGLPHNSICDIHQDRQGYLWLCTWYGLSRYDGNGFVNYTMLPGDYSNLSHNRILSVDEDAEGYLWVTTYDYHVYRFDVDTEEFVAVPADLDGFPDTNMKVGGVLCDSKGDVWVSVDGAGLLRVHPDLSYVAYFGANGPVGKNVSDIYEDSEGNVYAVSESGVAMFGDDSLGCLSKCVGGRCRRDESIDRLE